MRKVFLDDLPRGGCFINNNSINWKQSIGYNIKFIYDDIKGEIKIINYEDKCLYIKYLNNPIFTIKTDVFKVCKLGKLLNKYTDDFKLKIGQLIKGDKINLTITDKEHKKGTNNRNRKKYKYKCNICGFDCGEHYRNQQFNEEIWVEESSLLRGGGCACCNGSKIVVEGINDIPTTAPWMIKYFQGGYDEAKLYTFNSNKKIIPICPDCGKVKDKLMSINGIYSSKSIHCNCSDKISYPNKFMFNLLKQLNVEFTTEYSPDWIKPKRYDFYIPSLSIIIEMDGGLGHGKKQYNKNSKAVEETKNIDNYKNKMAEEHDIEVIRINCEISDFELIKNNIFKSKINKIFDLNKINWNDIEENSIKNIAKEVCNYKMKNKYATSSYIGKIFSLSVPTIIKYLKLGTDLGWCNYDANIERRRPKKYYNSSIKI